MKPCKPSHSWLSLVALLALGQVVQVEAQEVSPRIENAVVSPMRYDAERSKDVLRRPGPLLELFGLEKGDRVVEFQAGGGYFVSLAAAAVGVEGSVVAHNDAFMHKLSGGSRPLLQRITDLNLNAVEFMTSSMTEVPLPDQSVDIVLLLQDYHNTVWLDVDREAMLAEFHRLLKPGGVLGITDHHAQAGSGIRDVETLHRIDKEVVLTEVQAAGFFLETDSDILRQPDDPRTQSIFVGALRGATDQFALKFRKP